MTIQEKALQWWNKLSIDGQMQSVRSSNLSSGIFSITDEEIEQLYKLQLELLDIKDPSNRVTDDRDFQKYLETLNGSEKYQMLWKVLNAQDSEHAPFISVRIRSKEEVDNINYLEEIKAEIETVMESITEIIKKL